MIPMTVSPRMRARVSQSKLLKSLLSTCIIRSFLLLSFVLRLSVDLHVRLYRPPGNGGRRASAVAAVLHKDGEGDLRFLQGGEGHEPCVVHELLSREPLLHTHHLGGACLAADGDR